MWICAGYYLLGIKQTSNKKDNERIAGHAGNSKCHWNWLNNNNEKASNRGEIRQRGKTKAE